MIAQCSITAALAWLLARQLLGHQLPFFAPIAAIITLGLRSASGSAEAWKWRSASRWASQ